MCGIFGIIDRTRKPISGHALLPLRDSIEHRGPDGRGIHIEDGVGLGSRRLSILDLSLRGHMPMSNDDESLWITYNGEIYTTPSFAPSSGQRVCASGRTAIPRSCIGPTRSSRTASSSASATCLRSRSGIRSADFGPTDQSLRAAAPGPDRDGDGMAGSPIRSEAGNRPNYLRAPHGALRHDVP